MLIHDAAAAFVALIDAALAWAAVLAFTAIVIGWAGTLTGAWAVRRIRPSWARGRRAAARWARARSRDYDTAA